MSADDFEEDVTTKYVDRSGVTWAIATLNNIIMRLSEFRVFEFLEFGPNGEWWYEYDGGVEGEDDAVLRLLDKAGVSVVEREETRQQQSVERFSLIAEYDGISEIPELTEAEADKYGFRVDDGSGGWTLDPPEARHPRAIVRFTQTAANNENAIDSPASIRSAKASLLG